MNPPVFSRRTVHLLIVVGVVAALASVASTAYAQRPASTAVKPTGRRQPVSIFRLDAEDAAPSPAELQNRIMKSLTVGGRVATPKGNSVFEISPVNQEALKAAMSPEQIKAAEEKAKKKAEEKKKKAAEKAQQAEDAKIEAAVEKALAEQKSSALSINLSPQNTEVPGKASLLYFAPEKIDTGKNFAYFNQDGDPIEVFGMGFGSSALYNPSSYVTVLFEAKKGRAYLITLNFDMEHFSLGYLDDASGLAVLPFLPCPVSARLSTTGVVGGTNSFAVIPEKDGWYSFFLCKQEKLSWSLGVVSIKEITP
ncbi:MAG: hypothetical protein H7Y38_09465 [Armatimonadetes bacterium]|nr:hypothetical protein [Armatimonadota bacterium]